MTTTRRAYRIETDRLVLRCLNPADAEMLKTAIDESRDHLRPWMPWVTVEPETLDVQVERLRTFRARFDGDEDFIYGVFNSDETHVWGGTGLHARVGAGALEIGYWVHVDHVGRGVATELSAALTRVAFERYDVSRVHIHCAPDNQASSAVPRKLGYVLEATLRERETRADGSARDTQIWTLLRRDYPGSPSTSVPTRAFDAIGRELPMETLS